MKLFKGLILTTLLLFVIQYVDAQKVIKRIELYTDSLSYNSQNDLVERNGFKSLPFRYQKPDQVVLLRLFHEKNLPDSMKVREIKLVPSADFDIIDSIINYNDEYYMLRVKFKDLNKSELLNLSFRIFNFNQRKPIVETIPLFPFTTTNASVRLDNDDFFIGEEKIISLLSNNAGNIRAESKWVSAEGFDYMTSEKDGKINLHIVPSTYGTVELNPLLRTIQPDYVAKKITNKVNFTSISFKVKESRINFLGVTPRDFTYDESTRKQGVEIQLDEHKGIQLHKTYRIEDQEEAGGHLVAELFTQNRLSNGKIICILRLYNLHKQSDGYLYVKDGDYVKFITNFSVTPATKIDGIFLLHEGSDWTGNLNVFPGETVEVKIVGEGLNKSNFVFKDVNQIEKDTLIQDEKQRFFTLNIPVNISTKNIEIYNHSQNTSKSLRVREYQEPRDFDFVMVNYGKGNKTASTLNKPILYDQVIQDILISFNPNKIDSDKKIYGEQHITIRFKITTVNNQLVDQQEINNIVVCPGDRSPRAAYYNKSKCNIREINLNNYLRHKTYDIRDWSRIEIEIEHNKDLYGGSGFKQKIEIIYQRHYEFDIDVSFPAGLLVQKQGGNGFGSFGGISMAMIAQFSFFHPDKIARYRPYKIGAGFLALNAFNYNNAQNIDRDIGLVIIGSVYPMGSKGKLTFPLYLGGGYFLSQGKWFSLLGPGIRISF